MADPVERDTPFGDVSDDELGSLVDDVLRSGKHAVVPASPADSREPTDERLHARVIAGQLQQLASSLSGEAFTNGTERWYFEVQGRQLGPLTLREARKLWEDGALGPDSYCWTDGFSSWIALSKVTELAAVLAPKVPVKASPVPPSPAEEQAQAWKPQSATLADELFPQTAEPRAASEPVVPQQSAGIYYVLPTPPAEPARKDRLPPWLSQALVTGAVAGLVMAAILLLARNGVLDFGGPGAQSGAAVANSSTPAAPTGTAAPGASTGTVAAPGAATGAVGGPPSAGPGIVSAPAEPSSTAAMTANSAASSVGSTAAPSPGSGVASSHAPSTAATGPSSNATLSGVATAPAPSTAGTAPSSNGTLSGSARSSGTRAGSGSSAVASSSPRSSRSQNLTDEELDVTVEPARSSQRKLAAKSPSTSAGSSEKATELDGEVVEPEPAEPPPPTFGDDDFEREFGGEPAKPKERAVYIPPAPGTAPLPEKLGQAQVLEVVLANKPQIQKCIDAHRPEEPASGKLVMRWTLSTAGKTASVRAVSPSDLVESQLAACLADEIATWTFPKHTEQMEPVEVPFVF